MTVDRERGEPRRSTYVYVHNQNISIPRLPVTLIAGNQGGYRPRR